MSIERIDVLVALSVKNNLNPNVNVWVGFAKKILASKFGSTPQTMNSDIHTLVTAWRADHWRELAQDNPYLSASETQTWITSNSQ